MFLCITHFPFRGISKILPYSSWSLKRRLFNSNSDSENMNVVKNFKEM
jgi:hypothetical protein